MPKISLHGGPTNADEPAPEPEPEAMGEVAITGLEFDPVPSGSVDDVLAWVGDDLDRAQRALDVERLATPPRTTLTRELERRLV